MSKSGYDSKIIILDLDFTEIEQYSLDNILYAKKLLSDLSSNQNLIVLTNNHNLTASKVINELNLKSGYLITDSGSTTTNISTKNLVEEHEMNKDLCLKICYKCMWMNLCFVLSTKDTKYLYRINHWIINKYKSNISNLYEYTKNMLSTPLDLKNCIKDNEIIQIEILFLENDDELRVNQMESFINLWKNENLNFSYNCSCLNVNSNNKLNSINNLAKQHNWNLKESAIYIGINYFESEIANAVKFCAITSETKKVNNKNLSSNVEIIEWGDISWLNWLKENSHIWLGDWEEDLMKKLQTMKNFHFDKKQMNDAKENHLIFQNSAKKIRLNFWKEQIKNVHEFLDKK